MNLKTIYSTSPARGWLPRGLLAPVVCLDLAIVTEIASGLFLARFGFLDARGESASTRGLKALLLVSLIAWMLAGAAWIAFVARPDAGTIGLTGAGAAVAWFERRNECECVCTWFEAQVARLAPNPSRRPLALFDVLAQRLEPCEYRGCGFHQHDGWSRGS